MGPPLPKTVACEPYPEQTWGTDVSHSLALEQLLGIIMEIAFLNLPLSGEKRISSLLGHQAPGYLPWEPVQDASPGPCPVCCLTCLKVAVGRQMS